MRENNFKFICLYCEKEFKVPYCWMFPKNRSRQRSGKFCSFDCKKEHTRKSKIRNCKTCGSQFLTRAAPGKSGETEYCSRDCWNVRAKEIGSDLTKHLMEEEIREKAIKTKRENPIIGCAHHGFKRGITSDRAGYYRISSEIYGKENVNKLLHRYIVERHLGRPLSEDEIVHHKDKNKTNNDISNLQIMTNAEHTKLHHLGVPKPKKRKFSKFIEENKS